MSSAADTPQLTGDEPAKSTLAQEVLTSGHLIDLSRPEPSLDLIEIEPGYEPRESLGLSLILHGIALLSMVFLCRHAFFMPPIMLKTQTITSSDSVTLLPLLGGGSSGTGERGGGHGRMRGVSSGVHARSRKGFAYPGVQPMLSNPKAAQLGMQTLLQPSFENLPRLRHLVELPNIVQPPPQAATKVPALIVRRERVRLRVHADNPINPAKVVLPAAPESGIASLLETRPQTPQRAIPNAVNGSDLSATTRKARGLLVLNAVAPPPDVRNVIPHAEARSLFAVAPSETTVIAAPAAGSKSGGESAAVAGNGTPTDARTGDVLAEAASGGMDASSNAEGSGAGRGGRYGDGMGPGMSVASGSGSGRGDRSSSALGTGNGNGAGSGSGGGSAPGAGHFPGITIQGGRYGNGGQVSMLDGSSSPGQTAYNMTVISTGSSGGGLPDIGFFRNEKVYTVYLDMRSTSDDRAPSWTLQYSLLQHHASTRATNVAETISPPYAMLKEIPELRPELLQHQRLILVSAILDASGKLKDVAVRQSNEDALNLPILEALKNWMFQPGEIAGHPVELKVLLGIRFAMPNSRQ